MPEDGRGGVIPMLAYEDVASTIPWLERAFGFRERPERRQTSPGGTVVHAELDTGRGIVMVATPTTHYRNPRRHAETCEDARRWLSSPWVIDGVLVLVDDIAAHRGRAERAGVPFLSGLETGPAGRLYRAEDVEGHRWMFLEERADP